MCSAWVTYYLLLILPSLMCVQTIEAISKKKLNCSFTWLSRMQIYLYMHTKEWQILYILTVNPRIAHDNHFYGGFINFFYNLN